uniref:Uncharacterized protein n=1 Tax=Candidatus Methanogaster sp. ANME-2c ERB4 TaxID=2759911 RepID=A0A7G9YC22_9EURY|nr:hypothetical protein NHILIMGA_00002 [Methanosarcinales archaeon ANME-2c ERB4]
MHERGISCEFGIIEHDRFDRDRECDESRCKLCYERHATRATEILDAPFYFMILLFVVVEVKTDRINDLFHLNLVVWWFYAHPWQVMIHERGNAAFP